MKNELQNCLAEAQQRAADLSSEAPVLGEGPIAVTLSQMYFCKSTDAFAGMAVYERRRFTDHDAAQAWINAAYDRGELHDESGVDVVPPIPRPDIAFDGVDFTALSNAAEFAEMIDFVAAGGQAAAWEPCPF